jgi:hypothetical protein
MPAVEAQQGKRGQVPQLVAWDAGFYAHLQEEGVWVFGKRP